MATTKKTELVEIKPIEMVETKIRIVGDTPLIMHAWSAKAKREILEKEIGATKTKARDPKNPIEDFASSMYWLTPMPEEFTEESMAEALKTARFGFPVTGIKQAAISAAYRMAWTKDKMSLRGAFFIDPDTNGYYGGDLEIDYAKKKVAVVPNRWISMQMTEIHSDPPIMREDMVRVGMGAADIRYRGEFNNWWADLSIRFNANGQYSLEQIVNIIHAGGTVNGIGEWRAERDGQSGAFHVESI